MTVGTREQYLASISDRNNAAVAPAFDATLRPGQKILASQLRDGTTAGAMVLALMTETGKLPELALSLDEVKPLAQATVADYAEKWRRMTSEM